MSRINQSLFFRYLHEQRKWLFLGSICGLIMNTSVVLPPLILGRIIDAIGTEQVNSLLLLYFGSVLLYNIPRFGKRLWFRVTANGLNSRLKEDLLAAVFTYPMAQYEREKIGDIMSRAIGDAQSVADTVQVTATEVFDTAVMMASSFVVLMILRPRLTLAASLPVPFAVWMAQWMGPRIFARAKAVREASSALSQRLQQSVGGVRVLRLLGREHQETERFSEVSAILRDRTADLALLQGGVMPLYTIGASLGVVLVIGWGVDDILKGTWTLGLFTSYLTMFVNMAVRTLQGANVINRVYVGAAAWHRVLDKLRAAAGGYSLDSFDRDDSEHASYGPTSIHAKGLGVSFGDNDTAALSGVDLEIPSGSWVGVTGPVGCGKSALGLALSGLYPYSGSLVFGEKEVSSMTQGERVRSVAYMGENPFLFSSTIAENIAFAAGSSGADDDVQSAGQVADLDEDIARFERGYDTAVGEGGVRVSGGQRQRIALARTLYAGTPIIVLDEPFSAVDIPTEREMVKRLRAALRGRTVIVMSHRLISFVQADQVIVLDHGRVLEAGTHQELMNAGGLYSRIFAAQKWMEANEP